MHTDGKTYNRYSYTIDIGLPENAIIIYLWTYHLAGSYQYGILYYNDGTNIVRTTRNYDYDGSDYANYQDYVIDGTYAYINNNTVHLPTLAGSDYPQSNQPFGWEIFYIV